MNWKLWRLAAAILPICCLSAQQPSPQDPQPANRDSFEPPSAEAMRQLDEQRKRMIANAVAINDVAGHIQSLDDANKLVDLVAAEFSDELPPTWAARSVRQRIARAEYEAAADHGSLNSGSLIPEQHIADVWNDFLQRIGAPQESFVTAAEIHTLRDSYAVTAKLAWAHGNQSVWTVPNLYAVGEDGKVANGSRALEALNILWQLGNQPEALQGTRDLIKKGQLLSDLYKTPSKPSAPGSAKAFVSVRMMPPNPIEIAAQHYRRDHGDRALNSAIEGLLKSLFAA